jgi:uncharacterized membrane protein YdjX (TVP38/TMEM64 family)
MKLLLDFLSLPLSLPINPLWDFVICLVLGEVVYRFAYSLAGEYGRNSSDRFLLHWLIRIPAYFLLWSTICVGIIVARFLKANWMWILPIVFAVVGGIIGVVILVKRKKRVKTGQQKGEEDG